MIILPLQLYFMLISLLWRTLGPVVFCCLVSGLLGGELVYQGIAGPNSPAGQASARATVVATAQPISFADVTRALANNPGCSFCFQKPCPYCGQAIAITGQVQGEPDESFTSDGNMMATVEELGRYMDSPEREVQCTSWDSAQPLHGREHVTIRALVERDYANYATMYIDPTGWSIMLRNCTITPA